MQATCLKWHGGKSYLAKKIRELMPVHTRYCEPFFGGGAVLFAGDGEGVAEYVNDLNGELANFWSVMAAGDHFFDFKRVIEATPLSQSVFETAKGLKLSDDPDSCWPDPVRRAVAFFVINRQSRQGLGRDFTTPTSRLRRGMNEQVSAWLTAVDGLPEFHARLRRVEIRNENAIDFIRELDSPETVFYCDPPYLHSTRSTTKDYGKFEMGENEHALLLATLRMIEGKFLLSGYRSELYDLAAEKANWRRVDFTIDNKASSSRTKEKKTECVWMNY